jgi:aryl-alcohol dehydrogenase-like predicted oxidoreductase
MDPSFTHTVLGRTGLKVHRLGLSASYRPGTSTVRRAVDAGMNLFFGFGLDTQLTSVMRDVLRSGRERFVIATGPYNYLWGYQNIRRTLEKRLQQFGTEYIDLFLFLGVMKEEQFPPSAREEMLFPATTGNSSEGWPPRGAWTCSCSATTPPTGVRNGTSFLIFNPAIPG